MITTYLLENCKHCKNILKYIQENPNLNICLIIVSKNQINDIKKQEPRITEFPVAFSGVPKLNGFPYKNSMMLGGSNTILKSLKMSFGNNLKKKPSKLTGSNIKINYENDNVGNITNIRQYNKNCFGNSCHVMDRPYGPMDNKYILQGFQPSCAQPIRSDLPIKNKFGITTPGTNLWKSQRKLWPEPKILINDSNNCQNSMANKYAKINVPLTYSNDQLNKKCYKTSNTKYGNYIHALNNSNSPFLTYAAGANTISRINGKKYYPEQNPIGMNPSTAYLSGNLKQYVKQNPISQKMLYEGLNSPWSINGQGINKFGKISNKVKYGKQSSLRPKSIKNNYVQTIFSDSMGNSGIAQSFEKNRFPKNGNDFGNKGKNKMTFTSPLGIEFTI
jgi:hypothetical protein